MMKTDTGIPSHIMTVRGQGGRPLICVNNQAATATISQYGAQILSYQPHGERPVLWTSEAAYFEAGKAIRGGVPVIGPWFGAHPTDDGKPSHGFMRTATWDVVALTAVDAETSVVRLALQQSDETMRVWDGLFSAEITITIGKTLTVALTVTNMGTEPFAFGGALHSYFHVGDVEQISLAGLDGVRYMDKVNGGTHIQQGNVTFSKEEDLVYLDTTSNITLHDPAWQRTIDIAKTGSTTTVVWNPGTTAKKGDLVAGAYRDFVCVEPAKAEADLATVPPNGSFTLSTTIKLA